MKEPEREEPPVDSIVRAHEYVWEFMTGNLNALGGCEPENDADEPVIVESK